MSIKSKKEAIKRFDPFLIKSPKKPSSKQIVFFIQNASLRVNFRNSIFKHIFIRLRNIGNQEITQNDKKECYEEDPQNPN